VSTTTPSGQRVESRIAQFVLTLGEREKLLESIEQGG